MQLALLTATIKLFLKRPTAGGELVPKVLKWATEEVENPDCRDRGFMYWRLLSTDPAAAREIVLAEKPSISTETDRMDRQLLDQLLLHAGTLGSIFHRQPQTFIRGAKARWLPDSPALDEVARRTASTHLYSKPIPKGLYVPAASQAANDASAAPSQNSTATSADAPSEDAAASGPSNGFTSVRDAVGAGSGAANGATAAHVSEGARPPSPAGSGVAPVAYAGTGAGGQDGDTSARAGDGDPYAMLGDFDGGDGGYATDKPAPSAVDDLLLS